MRIIADGSGARGVKGVGDFIDIILGDERDDLVLRSPGIGHNVTNRLGFFDAKDVSECVIDSTRRNI